MKCRVSSYRKGAGNINNIIEGVRTQAEAKRVFKKQSKPDADAQIVVQVLDEGDADMPPPTKVKVESPTVTDADRELAEAMNAPQPEPAPEPEVESDAGPVQPIAPEPAAEPAPPIKEAVPRDPVAEPVEDLKQFGVSDNDLADLKKAGLESVPQVIEFARAHQGLTSLPGVGQVGNDKIIKAIKASRTKSE